MVEGSINTSINLQLRCVATHSGSMDFQLAERVVITYQEPTPCSKIGEWKGNQSDITPFITAINRGNVGPPFQSFQEQRRRLYQPVRP